MVKKHNIWKNIDKKHLQKHISFFSNIFVNIYHFNWAVNVWPCKYSVATLALQQVQ